VTFPSRTTASSGSVLLFPHLRLRESSSLTAARLAAFAAADKGERGPPLFDAENWAALKAICQ
jgi:hypothetical protein